MVHILEALARLETKFDSLTANGTSLSTSSSSENPQGSPESDAMNSGARSTPSSDARKSVSGLKRSLVALEQDAVDPPTSISRSKQHITIPHKVILWPTIYVFLAGSNIPAASDLQHVLQQGTSWFLRQDWCKHTDFLPVDVGLPSLTLSRTGNEGGPNPGVTFPTLSIQQIQEYTEAFFNTFNIIFPLLDRDHFTNETVNKLLRDGYKYGDNDSVIALLVFALGQVAIQGILDKPISVANLQPSGFRGGTVDHPPGLETFNEARRRHGFVLTHISLQNVQILLLMAIYYECNARHLDFWRSISAASVTCHILIRCQAIDWSSTEGDLIKRAYWVCVLSEDLYHVDLDLPKTGIQTFEDEVPLPFIRIEERYGAVGSTRDERLHSQYHFLAMITLRRLITRISDAIHDSTKLPVVSNEGYTGPPIHVIRELVRQLESWRALLPRSLQWSDQDRFGYPNISTSNVHDTSAEPLFTSEPIPTPIGHRNNLDITTAQLRSRFYQARFFIYRPFVYKALHFPELMTAEDVKCCAMAIESACMWPIAMSPPRHKKRLVPHLFAWTQNFLSILLLFRMTTENECLKRICDEHVDRVEIDRSIALMLEWLGDARQIDGVAEWSWKLLEPLFTTRTL